MMRGYQLQEAPTSRNAIYYNMYHAKRGMALIFNHKNFQDVSLIPRDGTDIDCEALMKCLTKLGFQVKVYQDLSKEDIKQELKKVSEMDHSKNDCLFVAISTHGEMGKLYAYDQTYETDSIWLPFTADKCPTLAGKPKIFVIQACRGKEVDHGFTLRQRLVTDSASLGAHTFRTPSEADFLFAYATSPGRVAWKYEEGGSWFILALCGELDKHAEEFDLVTMLTFVNQRVALEYESQIPEDSKLHKKKQIPCFESRLTRLIRFYPPLDLGPKQSAGQLGRILVVSIIAAIVFLIIGMMIRI